MTTMTGKSPAVIVFFTNFYELPSGLHLQQINSSFKKVKIKKKSQAN